MEDTQRDINARDAKGSTALHVAAARNWHRKAADLLSQGANANARNDKGETPLHVAAAKNASKVAEVLLEHGAEFLGTVIHTAAENDNLEVIKTLLTYDADLRHATDNFGSTLLHTAAANNSLEVIKTLLTHDADINATNNFGWTPLHSAIYGGGYALFKQQHDPSAAVEMLLNRDADIRATDNFGWTPLHTAAWGDRSAVIEILINHADADGAGIHARDHNGFTPLHIAAMAGAGGVNAVKVLLTHGGNIHATDNFGSTPLHVAAARKLKPYVKVIFMHSHLYYSPYNEPNRSVAVVEMLLAHGGNIYAPDHNNFTPLHLAAKENGLTIVKLLCQHAGSTWDTWYLDRPVTELGLTARVSNVLARYGISTCRDLFITTEEEVSTYNNFGPVALKEIKTKLAEAELTPGMNLEDEEDKKN